MPRNPRIPTKPSKALEDLLLRYGTTGEGLVEAFVLHQLTDEDLHFLSPTWLTCCLLRRTLSKLEEIRAAVRGEAPFDVFSE